MIPLTRHLNPHLAAFLDQLAIETRPNPGGGALLCDVITVIDVHAAKAALTAYHAERWNRPPGQAGPAYIRLSDLAELVGALLLFRLNLHDADSIYPLTFASPGPAAQPAGIDVVGVDLDLGVGPLALHERLSVAEAKSTLDDDAGNAISGIQIDIKKCNSERISDSLFVLKWEFERVGEPNHLRLHLFVTSHYLTAWCRSAERSRLKPFINLARLIRRHFTGIIATVTHGLSNSRLEGINAKNRLINRRGYGHPNPHHLTAMIHLCLGGITIPLPTQT